MEKLIFVYNAQSGKLNALKDAIGKIWNPSGQECNLCALTYGPFQERKRWRSFRCSLEMEMELLHKDEFQKVYASKFIHKFDFPVVLGQTSKGLEVVISRDELNRFKSPEELGREIKNRL